ncbi:MAG: DegT/DnrJ/EryC1/StrS aminotransferase family protein [Spirochaetes bacterium]|nr:DegT/DnrJ/EryC1/StrS aminotransferase family protein [Spirochaetota bacterium]
MNIPFHKPYITEDEINAAADMMRAGWLTAGVTTASFEQDFKRYIGCANAVSVNSATAGMHLCLAAMGLREHDEVLMPAMTFTATAEVVRYFNAWPVLVDIEPDTHLMDVNKIEDKITARTRAIMPVHFAGQPCDMDEILEIARGHGLAVIEDAAHCLPSWYKGRPVGSLGGDACFSFYATKTITTGEGGMVCTDSDERAGRMRTLRLHGIDRDAWQRHNSSRFWQYDVVEAGYKYNTTDIASAIGIEQLKKAEKIGEMRKRIAGRYTAAFDGCAGLLPYRVKPDRVTSWYLYPLDLDLDALSITRDSFIEEMRGRGVGMSVHFIPLYEFTYYKKIGYTGEGLDNCRRVFERTMSLPIFPAMSDDEVDYVIEQVLDLVKKNRR